MKIFDRIKKWYYFKIANPVVRKGEYGGFRWTFRRFEMDMETLSGNFKMRFTADAHPYGYLLAGKDDENIKGFCQYMYTLGRVLTTDQKLVDDIEKALKRYEKRLLDAAEKENAESAVDPEAESRAALDFEKSVQQFVEMSDKERRKEEKAIDKRFKKATKKMAQDLQESKSK